MQALLPQLVSTKWWFDARCIVMAKKVTRSWAKR